MFNLIYYQTEIDKIYLYAKSSYEAKCQLLINKRERAELKQLNDSKAFIEYSNDMGHIYKNIEEYNPNKKRKILIALDDMIADILNNKKRNPVETKLFFRGRKLNISLVSLSIYLISLISLSITQSYLAVPKNIRVNSTHYFIMKIPSKQVLQQIEFNHSSDIDLRDYMNLYEKYTTKLCSFLVIDVTLASDNPLRFKINILERI